MVSSPNNASFDVKLWSVCSVEVVLSMNSLLTPSSYLVYGLRDWLLRHMDCSWLHLFFDKYAVADPGGDKGGAFAPSF